MSIKLGFDHLAIRFGELPDSRATARRIMSNRRFPCASPLHLERCGKPETPADLASHRCIVHRRNDEAAGIWRFIHDGRSEVVKVQGALSSNDGDIVLGWALDGQGIVIRSGWNLNKYRKKRASAPRPAAVRPARCRPLLNSFEQ